MAGVAPLGPGEDAASPPRAISHPPPPHVVLGLYHGWLSQGGGRCGHSKVPSRPFLPAAVASRSLLSHSCWSAMECYFIQHGHKFH